MSRISPLPTSADVSVTAVLEDMKARMGTAPNFSTTIAQSPAAFNAYTAFSKALMKGRLTARRRESAGSRTSQQLPILPLRACRIGQRGRPQRCREPQARTGKSDNALDYAILSFALKAVQQKGLVSDAGVASARGAGIDDGLMLEIVADIALNTLTNYTNRLADTEIDFPVAQVAD